MNALEQKRNDYLKNFKGPNLEIILKNFFFVKDGFLPNEFETCIIIEKNGSLNVGIWDESDIAKTTDKQGSFFDGIGGHISADNVIAWKPLDGIKIQDLK